MSGQKEMISRNYVNYNFIPTYNPKIIYGLNFSHEYSTDNQNCIIHETALKAFGWTGPLGEKLFSMAKAHSDWSSGRFSCFFVHCHVICTLGKQD
jgi:hypothetical protein